ncbi:MAG TPA: 2Fe-2S iron-sulfur cluster binding domain-containing protein, partial [Desulfobacteraceae bacterium]|nr:2Fe-2S iron-sulfur cluster binding domain-containing protein [Desulfobacteraceae bacterium]
MFTIRFLPSGRSIDVSSPISVLEAARLARVQIESTCGGKQKCGKCKVVIRNSMPNILPPSAPEKNLLGPDLVAKGYRLACATMATDNLTVFV